MFFCRDAMNDDTTDSIVLKTKLAIDAKYFLDRPRPRLTDSVNTIESMMRLVCAVVDSTDDFIEDSIDDSVSERTFDEDDNSSLLST